MNLTLAYLSLCLGYTAPSFANIDRISLHRSGFRGFFHPVLHNVRNSQVTFSSFSHFLSPALRLDDALSDMTSRLVIDVHVRVQCCRFTQISGSAGESGGAIFVKSGNANVRIFYCEFNKCGKETPDGGAIFCERNNMLEVFGSRFTECSASRGIFIFATPSRRFELRITSFVGSEQQQTQTRDAIRSASSHHEINDVNCSKVKIENGFGCGLAIEQSELLRVIFCTFKDCSGRTGLWFWDIGESDATRVSQVVLLDVAIPENPQNGLIYSKVSLTASDCTFFSTPPSRLFWGEDRAWLTLHGCSGNAKLLGGGIIAGFLTPLDTFTRELSWPLSEFTNGNCPQITASPMATPSRSPLPTRSPSRSPSQSPTQSRSPSQSPTSEAEKPPVATISASPRPTRSPVASQSPTSPPNYEAYLGIAAAVALIVSLVIFLIVFAVGAVSRVSSEATLSPFGGRVSSAESSSASSSTEPLRIRSSSSDDAPFEY